MTLTKHQKLAKELQNVFTRHNYFFEKVAKDLESFVQFHFYEPYLCINRPVMPKDALKAMILTHKYGLIYFSTNLKLREICFSKDLLGTLIYPQIYKKSESRINIMDNCHNTIGAYLWKVKIFTPPEALKLLKKTENEALLYCASEEEMSEWIDWFYEENNANTFTNQILQIFVHKENLSILKRNLGSPVYQHFENEIIKYCGKWKLDKSIKTLSNAEFAPNKETSTSQAYEKVVYSLRSRTERHLDEFKRDWKQTLEELIFKNVKWTDEKKKAYLERWLSSKKVETSKERWESGRAIDRQTYSSYIQYFAQSFIKDPISQKHHGEIVLFLWIAIHIAQDPNHSLTEKSILKLTTSNVKDRIIYIENQEVEISLGLADLIKSFIGNTPLERHQKIFPNLSIDRLEDLFKKASKEILPSEQTPILPEAFLTFPHAQDHVRILAKIRKQRQISPPNIYYKSPSLRDIKKQLLKE